MHHRRTKLAIRSITINQLETGQTGMVQYLISTTLQLSRILAHALALELPWISRYHDTRMKAVTVLMSHSQFRNDILILRHAWLIL